LPTMFSGSVGLTAMAVSLWGLLTASQSVLTFAAELVSVLQMGLGGFLYCDSPCRPPRTAGGFFWLPAKAGPAPIAPATANTITNRMNGLTLTTLSLPAWCRKHRRPEPRRQIRPPAMLREPALAR